MRQLWWTVISAGAYLAIVESVEPGDVVVGLVLGAALTAAAHPWGDGVVRLRPWALPRLALSTKVAVAKGTVEMLKLLVKGADPGRAGIVEVPRGSRSDPGVALSGLIITLTPGTVYLGEDRARGVLFVHAVDATDAEQVRRSIQQMYEDVERPLLDEDGGR